MRRLTILTIAFVATAGTTLTAITPAAADTSAAGVEVTRFGGADRYVTSLRVAEAVASEAGGALEQVVLVSGRNWTDAVVAAPLAGHLGAAVLATPSGELRTDAADFLERAGVSKAWLIGANSDSDGVGPSVVSELNRLQISTTRISRSDHYSTAVAVAHEIGEPGDMGDLGSTAVVASGEVFADALVAGAFAARGRHPVLLTPRDELHDSAAGFLEDRRVEHVVLMGGIAALSAEVEGSIRALGVEITRLGGSTRYDTAVQAAKLTTGRYGSDCFSTRRAGLARARVPFDSFSAGPLLGRLCAPLLLADPGTIPDDTARYLDDIRRSAAEADLDSIDLRVFGGDAAVSQAAIDTYAEAAAEPATSHMRCDVELGDRPVGLLDDGTAYKPAWSPDCRQVAFIGLDDDDFARLFTANPDGSDRTQVTDDEVDSFAWSPDGTQFAFTRYAGFSVDGDSAHHLFVINADGSAERQITEGNFRDESPSWSPDGSRIAISRRDLDSPNPGYNKRDVFIATIDTDGQNLTPLTRGGIRDDHPGWSPDGQHIAYNSDGSIWIVRADGTEPRQVTSNALGADRVSWSPAGDALVFTRLEFLEGERRRFRLVMTSLSGSERTVASYSGASDSLIRIKWPQWSPDGRSILFERAMNTEPWARAYVAAVPQ